jgi:hypothetical protein
MSCRQRTRIYCIEKKSPNHFKVQNRFQQEGILLTLSCEYKLILLRIIKLKIRIDQ